MQNACKHVLILNHYIEGNVGYVSNVWVLYNRKHNPDGSDIHTLITLNCTINPRCLCVEGTSGDRFFLN